MTDTVEIPRQDLKTILKTYLAATDLFNDVVEMYDNGEMGKACQHIGAELEAGMQNMHELEENTEEIKEVLKELRNPERQDDINMENLEQDILGDIVDEEDLE